MKEYEPTAEERANLVPNKEGLKLSGDGIFYTLQGEGTTMGKPAVFLRLHFCNLHCSWCDTPYTWDRSMPEFWQEPQNRTVAETASDVEQAWGCEDPTVQKRLVITGGEPMLHREQLTRLMNGMPEWNFEIETNGTMMPTREMLAMASGDNPRLQFNCSPKLSNSGNLPKMRINRPVMNALGYCNTVFKFVVSDPKDLDEIEHDFIDRCDVPKSKVILMPEGVTPEALKEHALLVSEYAKAKGFRMLGRMQIDIWGKKRAV